jgi:uncharacterized protein (TIGR03066 family)
MNALRCVAAGFVVVAITAGAWAQKKDKAELLVGTWVVTKPDPKTLPADAVVVFNDGKVKLTSKVDGKEKTSDGTYTVDGDKVKVAMKSGGKETKYTITIKKISVIGLSAQNEDGQSIEFKRTK